MVYKASVPDNFRRRAADYVDRMLKGAKPGELPIQAPVSSISSLKPEEVR